MAESTARRRLKKAGSNLLDALAVVADAGTMSRMTDIEHDIDKLQEEYARLNDTLSYERRRPIPYVKK